VTDPRKEVADEVLSGYHMVRNFALGRNMLGELLEGDDGFTAGWNSGIAVIMIDLLKSLHHYTDTCALDWDDLVTWSNEHHRIEAGVLRTWALPHSALAEWMDWGFPFKEGDDGRILVMPESIEVVEWLVEQGGTEVPRPLT
jgi:hypothetical protein